MGTRAAGSAAGAPWERPPAASTSSGSVAAQREIWSGRINSSIDVERRAGDKTIVFGRKIRHRARNVIGCPGAAQRDCLDGGLGALPCGVSIVETRAENQPRRNGV